MTHDDVHKRRFKALIEELDKFKGRHTELVSVYIPSGYNIYKVAEQINSEKSTAQNIKSKSVRKNVLAALERISQHLKLYKQTPPNGLVIFAGNISQKDGVADIELFAIEPPEPLKQRLYWCNQKFVLEPLKEMIREREIFGLIVLDKSEADIGILQGKKIQHLKHLDSLVPGKTEAGGWSQARYARIREGLLNDFLKKIGEIASKNFDEYKDLMGIIIGGPGPVKDTFANGDFLRYDLKKKVIAVVDTSYTGEYGLEEAVNRSEEALKEASVMREKKLLSRFFTELGKDTGLAIYGLKDVVEALKAGNVEILLLSEKFDWVKAKVRCQKCNEEKEVVMTREKLENLRCAKCNEAYTIVEEKDITDDIIKMAEEKGTSVEMISDETKEGNQLKEMGGIGGILRYKL
jgi:peptide chain release factor subunit 1